MDGQPQGTGCRLGPNHAVPSVRRDDEVIAWFQAQDIRLSGKGQFGTSPNQQNEFILVLVVPEIFRRCMPPGDNPLDANILRRCEDLRQFLGQIRGNR